jgi:hypothetical protein
MLVVRRALSVSRYIRDVSRLSLLVRHWYLPSRLHPISTRETTDNITGRSHAASQRHLLLPCFLLGANMLDQQHHLLPVGFELRHSPLHGPFLVAQHLLCALQFFLVLLELARNFLPQIVALRDHAALPMRRRAVLGVVTEKPPDSRTVRTATKQARKYDHTQKSRVRPPPKATQGIPFDGRLLAARSVAPHKVVNARFDLVTSSVARRAELVRTGRRMAKRLFVDSELVFVGSRAAGASARRPGEAFAGREAAAKRSAAQSVAERASVHIHIDVHGGQLSGWVSPTNA